MLGDHSRAPTRSCPSCQPAGRPAFPVSQHLALPLQSQSLRTQSCIGRWEHTRQRLLADAYDSQIYEQARWLSNLDNPACA